MSKQLENYDAMARIVEWDINTLIQKGQLYGPSWRQRGGVGAFMMLARKWDRIHNWCADNGWDIFMMSEEMVENDIGDLRRYLLLVEAHINRSIMGLSNERYEIARKQQFGLGEYEVPITIEEALEPHKDTIRAIAEDDGPHAAEEHNPYLRKTDNEENVGEMLPGKIVESNPMLSKTMEKAQYESLQVACSLLKVLMDELDKCSDYNPQNDMLRQLEIMKHTMQNDLMRNPYSYQDQVRTV